METNFIICARCNQYINTEEIWVEETKDGLTCTECLTENEFINEPIQMYTQLKIDINKKNILLI